MMEHESDILLAEPEVETKEEPQQNSDFVETYESPKQNTQENKTVKKETSTFVNYNNNRLNKVYKKYDVVQTYVPKKEEKSKTNKDFDNFVTEQNSYVPERETLSVEKVESKPQFKLKSKAKVWLVAFSAIIVMLFGLCIYNGVHINNLNNQINQTTTSITDVNKDIEKVIKDIGKLTDEQEILNNASDLGYQEVTDANNVQIELEKKNEVEDYQSQTNFFDKICNFFRNMFGG